MPEDLRAALVIAAAFAACDPAPAARCVLDGLTDARGLVSTGSDCSLSFDGSGVVDGLADLHAGGLRLFFVDGCVFGVRRAVRISHGDYYTLSQSDFSGELKTVDVNIRRLRIKIEADPTEPEYLTTVWGYGYKWGY